MSISLLNYAAQQQVSFKSFLCLLSTLPAAILSILQNDKKLIEGHCVSEKLLIYFKLQNSSYLLNCV
jgi:hypothetical protein